MMSDFAGLGQIGTALINAFQNAVGTLYRPSAIRAEGAAQADVEAYKIVKLAEAQRQAQLIQGGPELVDSGSGQEQNSLRERAGARLVRVETIRQANLERIAHESLELAKEFEDAGSSSRPIDDDWMSAFIGYARNVSEQDIRRLWAQILASQAVKDKPKISRATLDALRLLEPDTAKQFEHAVAIFLRTGQIMSVETAPSLSFNVDSLEAMQLADIGFLRRVDTREGNLDIHGGVLEFLDIFDQPRRSPEYVIHRYLQSGTGRRDLKLDRYLLTGRGFELATILFPDFYDIASGARPLADKELTRRILDEWAFDLSERDILVCRSDLEWQNDLYDPARDRRVSRLQMTSYFDPKQRVWTRIAADLTPIYKIVNIDEWNASDKTESYAGSEKDRADGFMHFSKAWQLEETLKRHYANDFRLLIVTVDGAALGSALKYEPSRNGEMFPHLYGTLPMWAVIETEVLGRTEDKFFLPLNIRPLAERK